MTNPLRPRPPRRPAPARTVAQGPRAAVEAWTTHYRLINGQWYRDAIVREPSGALTLYAIREDVAA